jgi:ankyrin repeat protein
MTSRARLEDGIPPPAEVIPVEEKTNYTAEEFINTVRFGIKLAIENMVSVEPHLVSTRDSKGNTCIHWAAKRGDVSILTFLFENGAAIDLPTMEEPNMLPIHWAAAEGQVDAIQFFLNHNQNINAQDGSNACSVAVIAVQFNQLRSLVYLAKRGADLTIRDNSGDHCLHWSAYKGYEELIHVVLYFLPSELNARDNFGQTALHLAAIKGHTEMIRSLIEEYKADYSMQDKGGLTALDHSISKGNFMTEWVIRSLTAKSYISRMKAILFERFKERRFWMGVVFGLGMKEQSVWLWRGTFFSNVFASIMTIYYAIHEKMGDLYVLHIVNTALQVIWWICFMSCGLKEPGFVRETDIGVGGSQSPNKRNSYGENAGKSDVTVPLTTDYDAASGLQLISMPLQPSRSKYTHYDEGLDIIAKLKDGPKYKLCHTCRCARPLRSKHDKIINRCVQKFDHFW